MLSHILVDLLHTLSQGDITYSTVHIKLEKNTRHLSKGWVQLQSHTRPCPCPCDFRHCCILSTRYMRVVIHVLACHVSCTRHPRAASFFQGTVNSHGDIKCSYEAGEPPPLVSEGHAREGPGGATLWGVIGYHSAPHLPHKVLKPLGRDSFMCGEVCTWPLTGFQAEQTGVLLVPVLRNNRSYYCCALAH